MSSITSEIPREKLKELVDKNGESLLQDPDRCEGLLKDHCGSHRREISALVGALEERVPLELKSSWQTAMTPEAMRARLVQRLEENRGLAPDVANWAVDAWSYALGVGLGRKSDRVEDAPVGAAAGVAGAAVLGGAAFAEGTGASVADRVASDRAGGAAVLENGGAGAKKGLAIAQMSTPRKAGIGAVAMLALAGTAIAVIYHPKPKPPVQPPTPVVDPSKKPPVSSDPGKAGTGTGTQSGAQGSAGTGQGGTVPPVQPHPVVAIDAGTPIVIRLNQGVNSDAVNVGDVLEATVISPLTAQGNVVVPSGASARVRVAAVDRTGQAGGAEHMQLALVDVSTTGGNVRVSTYTQTFNGPHAQASTGAKGVLGSTLCNLRGGIVFGKWGKHTGTQVGVSGQVPCSANTNAGKLSPVIVGPASTVRFRLAKPVAVPA